MFEVMYPSASNIDCQVRGGTYPLGFDISTLYDMGLGDCIKTSGECEVYLYTELGEKVDDQLGYVGYCVIMHSKGVITSDGTTHTGVCEACDITYLVGEHYAQDPVKSEEDETVHNVNCRICSYTIESEKHSGGEATCNALATCEICSSEYGGYDESAHKGGTATCIQAAVCEVCENEYGDVDTANHESSAVYYEQNGEEHNVIFECCKAVKSTEAHKGGTATCTQGAVCQECEAEYGESLGHKYENACDSDCDVCGAARSIQHAYNDSGVCTACGDTNGQKAEEEDSGATVVIIVVSATVVALGGGFSTYWFVIKKKKR